MSTKLEARELGADHVINHYQQKISDEVRKITNKEGVDIVVEHVGAATWDESMKSLKPARDAGHLRRDYRARSRASICAFCFARQLSFSGRTWARWANCTKCLRHVFSGRLKPVVDRRFR